VVTSAAVGWRRPTILLSTGWTKWTRHERRAVLAHEIAHIRHNDFLACLCGQLGLALHFYHPLVHWLMGRLRLEQELAADWAAVTILGGRREYLRAIARLALHQQDRPLAWPARSFLPTRTTFLRRIAMLRDAGVGPERRTLRQVPCFPRPRSRRRAEKPGAKRDSRHAASYSHGEHRAGCGSQCAAIGCHRIFAILA